ncbi:MAG: hypothetical protein A4E61_01596 [Syntrophorhabdus sp. PtaB.Bin184]|nr:MAG: hypothetical protein A4E61_01596 [Syntrophorhabdus sp. PtaB.Bin184]
METKERHFLSSARSSNEFSDESVYVCVSLTPKAAEDLLSLTAFVRQSKENSLLRDIISIDVSDYRPNWIVADYDTLSDTDQATFDDSHDYWVEVHEQVTGADDEQCSRFDLYRMTVWEDAVRWQATYKNADETLGTHLLYRTDLERIAAGLPFHWDRSADPLGASAKAGKEAAAQPSDAGGNERTLPEAVSELLTWFDRDDSGKILRMPWTVLDNVQRTLKSTAGAAGTEPSLQWSEADRYRVVWEIDLYAETPEEAAKEAVRIQQKPDSIAHVFTVIDRKGEAVNVDLNEGKAQEVEP